MELVAFRTACILTLMMSARFSWADDRPNIVIILADDMGYADMGSFGGEINTPNIDSLALDYRVSLGADYGRYFIDNHERQVIAAVGLLAASDHRPFPTTTGVKCVNYDGYIPNFCPGVGPFSAPDSAIYLPVIFSEIFYKGPPGWL